MASIFSNSLNSGLSGGLFGGTIFSNSGNTGTSGVFGSSLFGNASVGNARVCSARVNDARVGKTRIRSTDISDIHRKGRIGKHSGLEHSALLSPNSRIR